MSEKLKNKKLYFAAAAAIILIAVIIAVIVCLCGRNAKSYRSIKVAELSGSVIIERKGVGSLDASENMNLVSGDYLRTADDAYVVLRLDADKYVMLGESGAMEVTAEGNESDGKTSIRLDEGSVLSELQNPLSERAGYEIATPNATMSVRGTVYEVRKLSYEGENAVMVIVYEGNVAVGLGDKEPVLYGAGEYTIFTDSNPSRFLTERGEIQDSIMDEQMINRLQQINGGQRKLNMGKVKLEDWQVSDEENVDIANQEKESEDSETLSSEEEPEETVSPAATKEPAASKPKPTKKPEATKTPEPVRTPESAQAPEVSATPEPTNPPEETRTPEPEETPEPTRTPEPTKTPEPTRTPEPTKTPEPTIPPQETTAPSISPTPDASIPPQDPSVPQCSQAWCYPDQGSDGSGSYHVYYFIPGITSAYQTDGVWYADYISVIPNEYKTDTVQALARLDEPNIPTKGKIPNGNELGVSGEVRFAGWYTEAGEKWDFTNGTVNSNLCLFSVWEIDGVYYYPVIYRDSDTNYYYCVAMREGCAGFERPEIEGVGRYEGYTYPHKGSSILAAWIKTNQDGALWGMGTEVVDGVESLKALWVDVDTSWRCLVKFAVNDQGDLADIFLVEPSTTERPAPSRAISNNIILNGANQGQPIEDWVNSENTSYKDVMLEPGNEYLFKAKWGASGGK